ncbi:MAG: Gfo/Idh/MocA family oxidoreductase [Planctomycetota bacterium]|nr:Gfo/Idh/MocA family oxidoreductase [Planctomycetota bacterium]
MSAKSSKKSKKASPAATNKPKVRIGFIGSGGIMNWHVDRLKKAPAEIVALADTAQGSIDRMKERQPQLAGAAEYLDWQKMLAAEKLDAVILGSPHTVHYEQICAALDHGLHVLSEKPMTCTSAHARDIIQRAKKAKKVVGISYQRHFQGVYRFLRELVQTRKLGKITYVAAFQAQEWLHAVSGTWRQTQALGGGGQINDSGSHLLDMVMWTTGLQASEVSCRQEFFGTEVDINSAVNVKFTNGALGTISIIGSAPVGFWEDFTIVGDKGCVFNRQGKVTWQDAAGGTTLELNRKPDWMDPDTNFVAAIRGEAEIGCPPEIGLRVIELTEAAWRSHKQGGAVVKVERS